MRPVRPALEFRMKLYSDKEWFVADLYSLYKPSVRRDAAQCKAGLRKPFPVIVVEFIAVTVTFTDSICTVAFCDPCPYAQNARVRA